MTFRKGHPLSDKPFPKGRLTLSVVLRAAALLLFFVVTSWVLVYYWEQIGGVFTEPAKLQEWVESFGTWGPLVFLGVQVVQVVVFAIPGEVVQVAAGYLFGTWMGLAWCMLGALIGSAIAFMMAKWLGRPFVERITSAKNAERLEHIVNHRKGMFTIFVLYLIPGIPKDILCYMCGLTPMKLWRFLIVSMVARLPAMLLSTWIGRTIADKNYVLMIFLASVAVVGFILGLVFRKRIEAWFQRQ